ncbi:sulfur transferase domain-containing protein [Gammaproteobacteria bacterium AB-CW1]|uniref:Sulfur transferase domain-containing protein n=1 Tax=Natronospira elongata TaxID=3110268 RepID=A0AAP6MLK3_9GAMM|nr:sulfur transferase domain-containing protein [Gammaproteobacteria bacterium AB-CW1]
MRILAITATLLFLAAGGQVAASPENESMMPDIPDKTQPDEKTLIGGQPDQRDLYQAKEAGIRTVVNLRGVGEFDDWAQSEVVTDLGMLYIHIPVDGANGLTRPAVEAFDRAVKATNDEPALFHCASGNRVGAMFALRAGILQDQPVEVALDIGRKHGMTGLEDEVRQLLESGELPGAG